MSAVSVNGGPTAEELVAVLVALRRTGTAAAISGYEQWRAGRIEAVAQSRGRRGGMVQPA